ncbi:MAG: tRNA (adenosine(37)-N6)-dimethylallyltransferase MiaA [Bacteroidales bacterium]|nr:tRNA (adenosine(37)-N6)-dimethylallyltransferase MiaA [Bacteroidales bacterium]
MPARGNAKYDILVITGPTASGKTATAAVVAERLGGEIISADSRQVYRKMDLGTGKDYDDYMVGGKRIPFHLIDIARPGSRYNLFEYRKDFLRVYSELKSRNVFPVLCGGSGMYIDSIVSAYRLAEVAPDPVLRAELEKKPMAELVKILSSYKRLHNITDIDTRKRVIRAIEIEMQRKTAGDEELSFPRLRHVVAAISVDRESRRERISARLRQRLESGMIDEVRDLLARGVGDEDLIYYGLEYKYITFYLRGDIDYDTMLRDLEVAIHQYAKRQMTWFRGMERKGTVIHWVDGQLPVDERAGEILRLLKM